MVAVLALAGAVLLCLLVLLVRRAARDHAAFMAAMKTMERTARERRSDHDDPL